MRRVELPSRTIDRFGSQGFTHSRIARGEVHVSLALLDGVIGGREAASRQLLAGRLGPRGVRLAR